MAEQNIDSWVSERPDFRAGVRFFAEAEGGLRELPTQGASFGFQYLNDADKSWIVHSCFLDTDGTPLSGGSAVTSETDAFFRIEDENLRTQVHRAILEPGTEFFLMQGNCRVAEGAVKDLIGLHQDEFA